jgi:RNA polymerase sigma-70 factor (ECF subfamily)
VLPRQRARHADLAPVEGTVGLVVASRGRLLIAVTLAVEGERITAYEVIADPVRLRGLDLAVLEK